MIDNEVRKKDAAETLKAIQDAHADRAVFMKPLFADK